jgi:hypothetical protein
MSGDNLSVAILSGTANNTNSFHFATSLRFDEINSKVFAIIRSPKKVMYGWSRINQGHAIQKAVADHGITLSYTWEKTALRTAGLLAKDVQCTLHSLKLVLLPTAPSREISDRSKSGLSQLR